MKKQNPITRILALAAILLPALPLQAAEGHSHAEKKTGPNGGRLLTSVEPHAEFLLTPERKVQITFVDEKGNAVAPAVQVVTVTTGERSAPVKLTFSSAGQALLSEQPVPAGDMLPVVVQIKINPEAKPVAEKFILDLSICPGCDKAEYACVCSHSH